MRPLAAAGVMAGLCLLLPGTAALAAPELCRVVEYSDHLEAVCIDTPAPVVAEAASAAQSTPPPPGQEPPAVQGGEKGDPGPGPPRQAASPPPSPAAVQRFRRLLQINEAGERRRAGMEALHEAQRQETGTPAVPGQ